MYSRLLIVAAVAAVVRCEPAAADTLKETIQWIQSGKLSNTFFHGDVLTGNMTEKEKVGGCLLDKVGLLVEAGFQKRHANDLQVDLAACCTKKDTKKCISEMSAAYALITDIKAGKKGAKNRDAQIVGYFLQAVRNRVKDASKVKKTHRKYLAMCKGAPGDCTMKKLKTAVPAAADTLKETTQWIKSGKLGNNFFHGDVFLGKMTEKEEVAGCLLDKVGLLVEDGCQKKSANDLQVDLAACCTKKDTKKCISEMSAAYALITDIKAGKKGAKNRDAHMVGYILQAVRNRVKDASKVRKDYRKYLAMCKGAPTDCTMKKLKTVGRSISKDADISTDYYF